MLIVCHDLWKIYRLGDVDVEALRGVSMSIGRGEFVAIMGASGSGKSTLMNILGCLDTPTKGRYSLEGREVASAGQDELAEIRNRRIGFVFQNFNLIPRTSALENVQLPLLYRGLPVRDQRARAGEALARVGLAGRVHHSPAQLSGGQQQRVGLARALAARPRLMLMDEPFGSLDPVTRAELQGSYRRLHDELGLTTLLVTHDVVEALLLADRVLFIHAGRVLLSASPRELLSGAQPEPVARLLEVPRRQMDRLEQLVRG
jgi:putative ABC transport system ATP-binding protein